MILRIFKTVPRVVIATAFTGVLMVSGGFGAGAGDGGDGAPGGCACGDCG